VSFKDLIAEKTSEPEVQMDNQTILAVECLKEVCTKALLMKPGGKLPDDIPKTVAIAAVMLARSL